MNRVLIEEGNIELVRLFQTVSAEARKEKTAIPAINEMLYWWTRKPLIVARAVALTSTLKDFVAAKQLLGINSEKRAYRTLPDVNRYKAALNTEPRDISVLDPFGGAGNLVFEAKQLGLTCHAQDYNPVAYLIMKAVLEYPSRYGTKLQDDIEKYAKEIFKRTEKEIGQFFKPTEIKPLVYLWMCCIRCPYCKQRIPLTNHMWIAKTPKRKVYVKFTPTKDRNFRVELVKKDNEKEGNMFTQRGGKAICIACRNSIDYEYLTQDIAKNNDQEMIAVVTKTASGRDYVLASDGDRRAYSAAAKYLKKVWSLYEEEGLIPVEEIRASHRRENLLWHYGRRQWYQFFNDRQLLVMLTILKNTRIVCREIQDKEYAKVLATYLAFIMCKHMSCNTVGVVYDKGKEIVTHSLMARRPSMMYNFAEINPFVVGRGTLPNALANITNAIGSASLNKNHVKVTLGSALKANHANGKGFDLIITDPPYSDDVQYAELSDFFYVWLYRMLKDYYPELPPIAPTEEDIAVSWGRFGNKKLAEEYYEKAMKEAFKKLNDSLNDDGLLVLFFAHSSTEAWNLLLEVIRNARFKIVSSYAVHTESVLNPIARGKTSFMSSIVVACRKVTQESTSYFEDLLPKVEDKVKKMLSHLATEDLLDLPITDLLIMTYGKVLEEATQHTILKSYRADFKPEFEVLIRDAREFILKEIVTKLTGRSPNVLGSDTSFYLVTKVFFGGILDSSEALKIGWAYQVKIDDLEKKQVVKKVSGVTRLLFFDEVDISKKAEEIDRNNLHQQLLYLEGIADRQGVSGVKRALQFSNFRVEDLKQIIALLVKSYRMRTNKGESLESKEQKELKILEILADLFGSPIKTGGGSLDKFM